MIWSLVLSLAHAASDDVCGASLATQRTRVHPRYLQTSTRGLGPIASRLIDANGSTREMPPDRPAALGFDFVDPGLRQFLKLVDQSTTTTRTIRSPRVIAWYGPIKNLGMGFGHVEFEEVLIDEDDPNARASDESLGAFGAAMERGKIPVFVELWRAVDYVRQGLGALITPPGYLEMMHAAYTRVQRASRRGTIVDQKLWRLRPLLARHYEQVRAAFAEMLETADLDDVDAFAKRVGIAAATLEVREPEAFVKRCLLDPDSVLRDLQIRALDTPAGPGIRLIHAEALARRERLVTLARIKAAIPRRRRSGF